MAAFVYLGVHVRVRPTKAGLGPAGTRTLRALARTASVLDSVQLLEKAVRVDLARPWAGWGWSEWHVVFVGWLMVAW